MLAQSNTVKNLTLLSFFEFWDRYCFYGTLNLLLIVLVTVHHLTLAAALPFWGTYAALGFALPALGGYVADRIIGIEHAMLTGSVLIALGSFVLTLPWIWSLYLGLAISVCGIGLFKGNITACAGGLYERHDQGQDTGYCYFFMGMSGGTVIGSALAYAFAYTLGWQIAFLINGLGMLSALLLYLTASNKIIYLSLPQKRPLDFNSQSILWCGVAVLTALIMLLFYHSQWTDVALRTYISVAVLLLVIALFRYPLEAQKKMIGLLILSFVTACYFATTLQIIDGSLLTYMQQYIDPTASARAWWTSPSSLNPIFAFLFAPLFALLWHLLRKRKLLPSISLRFIIGLLLASAGFGCFALSTAVLSPDVTQQPLFYLVAGSLLIGASGACIIPTIMSAVARYAPLTFLGTLMGMWFMSHALAGYLGSIIGGHSQILFDVHSVPRDYRSMFNSTAMIILGMAVLVLLISPLIRWLFDEKN